MKSLREKLEDEQNFKFAIWVLYMIGEQTNEPEHSKSITNIYERQFVIPSKRLARTCIKTIQDDSDKAKTRQQMINA